MRIRHYGFLANACRKRKLGLIKAQALTLFKVVKTEGRARAINTALALSVMQERDFTIYWCD